MSRSQREKGKRGEREIAADLRAVLGQYGYTVVRRSQGAGAAPTQQSDVEVVPTRGGAPWLGIEVKRQRRASPRAALAQAVEACGPATVPIAVVRDDGTSLDDALAVMRWGDLRELVVCLVLETYFDPAGGAR